jgi:polyisoprenoid-binding protein YceI
VRRSGGQVQIADLLENSSVEVVIDDDTRDGHLRSPDFLDVTAYPDIRYKIDGLRRLDPTHWLVDGLLTLEGVSAGVPLQVEYRGTGPDLWGGIRAAFGATAEVSRDAFEMSWNQSGAGRPADGRPHAADRHRGRSELITAA